MHFMLNSPWPQWIQEISMRSIKISLPTVVLPSLMLFTQAWTYIIVVRGEGEGGGRELPHYDNSYSTLTLLFPNTVGEKERNQKIIIILGKNTIYWKCIVCILGSKVTKLWIRVIKVSFNKNQNPQIPFKIKKLTSKWK